jgi:hypothetical protein
VSDYPAKSQKALGNSSFLNLGIWCDMCVIVRSGTESRECIRMIMTGGKRGFLVFEGRGEWLSFRVSEMEITDNHVTTTLTRLAGWNTGRIGAKRKLINS